MSIPPHSFFQALRFGFRLIQLAEARARCARRDACQSVAHQDRVHADAVAGDHIGNPTRARRSGVDFSFQPDPTTHHETRQPLARGIGDDGRNLDAAQPHMADRFDVDGVAADHGPYQEGLGYLDRRQRSGRDDNSSDEGLKQYLHRDLL
jgi:hypothetical protein